MKKVLLFAILLSTLFCLAAPLHAGDKPIQVALFSPVQIFPENNSIAGLRLTILYGKNVNMTGLDLGFVVTRTTGIMQGIQSELVGIVDGDATGIQWNGVTWDKANFTGVQLGAVNITKGTMTGIQWGYYNQSNHASGLQVALVNNTTTMKGIQLGFINIIHKGGWLPVFPIINGSFPK